MCVLLHLLTSTPLRAHIIVAEALYKRYYCNQVHLLCCCILCVALSVFFCVLTSKQTKKKKERNRMTASVLKQDPNTNGSNERLFII